MKKTNTVAMDPLIEGFVIGITQADDSRGPVRPDDELPELELAQVYIPERLPL